jgi:hypothetical protein
MEGQRREDKISVNEGGDGRPKEEIENQVKEGKEWKGEGRGEWTEDRGDEGMKEGGGRKGALRLK